MSAERATYIDSSGLVKLAVREPDSDALRRYLRRRRPLVSSALARTEVSRALLPLGLEAIRRGRDVLARIDLVRVNDRVLDSAGAMLPADLGTLDAIHLATAQQLGADLARIVTYDKRTATAAESLGWTGCGTDLRGPQRSFPRILARSPWRAAIRSQPSAMRPLAAGWRARVSCGQQS